MTMTEDFDLFWKTYPRRVGKLAALKAYQKARSVGTSDEIQAGASLYLEHLPDDPTFIPHAATWLNKGRWMDEYEAPVFRGATTGKTAGNLAAALRFAARRPA